MMAAMAAENGDGAAESASAPRRAEVVSALRIESAAIAWSSRERVRSIALRGMGWSTAAAVVALGVGIPLDSGLAGGVFGLSMLAAALSGLGLLPTLGRGTPKAGVVERRSEALVIAPAGVEQRIALDAVQGGWIEDVFGEGEACDVVLRLHGGRDVSVRVSSRNEGESLLRAARVSVVDRVLCVPLRSLAATQRFGEVMGIASMALILPFVFAGGAGLIWFVITCLAHSAPIDDTRGLTILVSLLLALNVLSIVGVRWLARFPERGAPPSQMLLGLLTPS